MRTPGVVVRYILPQDCQQVAPAEHQHVIEAFLADGAYPPLGEGVGSWRADRRLDDLHVLGAEDLVEGTGELGVPGHGSGTGRLQAATPSPGCGPAERPRP